MIDKIDTLYYVFGDYTCEIKLDGSCKIYYNVIDKYWC